MSWYVIVGITKKSNCFLLFILWFLSMNQWAMCMHQPGIKPGSHRRQRCILPLDHWCSCYILVIVPYWLPTPFHTTSALCQHAACWRHHSAATETQSLDAPLFPPKSAFLLSLFFLVGLLFFFLLFLLSPFLSLISVHEAVEQGADHGMVAGREDIPVCYTAVPVASS